jgi:leader peptidase (prepilin peptidase) / N-methyltransferase
VFCIDEAEDVGSNYDLRPNSAILIAGSVSIGIVSMISFSVPVAVASIVLGVMMVAGADVDARTYLLPNVITLGAAVCGVIATCFLDDLHSWPAISDVVLRALGVAGLLALLRWCYGFVRLREGLGWGDVKLAAAVGAWLPLDSVPFCFGLAASGALLTVLWARLRGDPVVETMKIPLGAFLCPALWLVFYASRLQTA